MRFKTIMIYVDDDPVSKAYVDAVRTSWDGFGLQFSTAVTPETLDQQSGLTFGLRGSGDNTRELTNTEKACLYSQYNLWKKCAVENIPILILEHDALCVRPGAINFSPHFDVQFFGQHAMEAVMFHPRFAKRLVMYCSRNPVTGPMSLVDGLLGYFNRGEQSRYGRPHARFMGPMAPVKSVIDPLIGTTVQHDGTTVDRLAKDKDLFEIVDISASYLHYKR